METSVTKGEQSAQLVHMKGGLDLVPLPDGLRFLYRQSWGPLTMVKFPYNLSWVT
jgi:hypothetical protein